LHDKSGLRHGKEEVGFGEVEGVFPLGSISRDGEENFLLLSQYYVILRVCNDISEFPNPPILA
jgi:hypothetical protein